MRHSTLREYALLAVLAASAIFIDYRTDFLSSFRAKSGQVVAGVVTGVHYPIDAVSGIMRYTQNQHQLVQNQLALTQELQTLRLSIEDLNHVATENEQLKALLGQVENYSFTGQLTRIYSFHQDKYNQQILLDKGKAQGIKSGQPVIDVSGIVGLVTDVFPEQSTAALITDASIAVPVANQRSGYRAIVKGTGQAKQMSLQHVASTADFQVGDVLITSGLGGRFKAGYPVGIVQTVQKNTRDDFLKITVNPAANIEQSVNVFVLNELIEVQDGNS